MCFLRNILCVGLPVVAATPRLTSLETKSPETGPCHFVRLARMLIVGYVLRQRNNEQSVLQSINTIEIDSIHPIFSKDRLIADANPGKVIVDPKNGESYLEVFHRASSLPLGAPRSLPDSKQLQVILIGNQSYRFSVEQRCPVALTEGHIHRFGLLNERLLVVEGSGVTGPTNFVE
jgi:hypothetical protein